MSSLYPSRWPYVLIVSILLAQASVGQPSLLSSNVITLTISNRGQQEAYTLYRDALNSAQWYYLPNMPRLTENVVNDHPNPELTLMRYQFSDPSAADGAVEGGLLQFSVSLGLDGDGINNLKSQLKAMLDRQPGGSPANLSLAALPIKSAHAYLYTPGGSDSSHLVSQVSGSGTFPTAASQKAIFTIYLTKWGSDLNDALVGHSVSSNTGVPLVITFIFQGLTPPAHLRVTANYSKIMDHYSHDAIFAAKASYFGLFGASAELHWTSIYDKLKSDGSLTVERIDNVDIDQQSMDAVMQGVMKHINDKVLELLSPPPAIPPASVSAPDLPGRFASVGYNSATKQVHYENQYKETFEWNESKIVDRMTMAGGFIGLMKYPDDIRNKAVQFVPGFNWSMAHLMLPDISGLTDINKVEFSARLFNGATDADDQAATWQPQTGWLSVPGNRPVSSLSFSIASLIQNGAKLDDLVFKTSTTVLQGNRQTTLEQIQKVARGGIPIAPPGEDLFPTITFDPSDLSFKALTDTSHLLRVQVVMKAGSRTFSEVIQPIVRNGKLQMPDRLSWLISKDEAHSGPIEVNLRYMYAPGGPQQTREVKIADLLKSNQMMTLYYLEDSPLNR